MRTSCALLTLKGHQGAITTVGFSIDGKQLATASADKTARVWDLENAGAAIRPLEGSHDRSFMARFSPDGQLIAAAGGGSIRLWDAATGRLVRQLSAGDKQSYLQRGILAYRLPPVGRRVRRASRCFLCRTVGHRCRNRTNAVNRERPICPTSGWTIPAVRSVRWRFRPMGNIWPPDSAIRDGLRPRVLPIH